MIFSNLRASQMVFQTIVTTYSERQPSLTRYTRRKWITSRNYKPVVNTFMEAVQRCDVMFTLGPITDARSRSIYESTCVTSPQRVRSINFTSRLSSTSPCPRTARKMAATTFGVANLAFSKLYERLSCHLCCWYDDYTDRYFLWPIPFCKWRPKEVKVFEFSSHWSELFFRTLAPVVGRSSLTRDILNSRWETFPRTSPLPATFIKTIVPWPHPPTTPYDPLQSSHPLHST